MSPGLLLDPLELLERLAAGAPPDFERDLIRERVVAGIRRTQAQGRHVGRPAKYRVDPTAAQALLTAGDSLRGVARHLGVHPSAVRRALLSIDPGRASGLAGIAPPE